MRTNTSISYSLDSSFDELFEGSFGTSGSIETDLDSVPSKEQISAWNKIRDGMKQSRACFLEDKNQHENITSNDSENGLAGGAKNLQQKITNEGCNSCSIVPLFLRDMLKLDQGNDDLVCGRVSDESGNTYTGRLEEGKPNGFGKMLFSKTGDQYEGYWKNSRPHGPGQFIRADGGEFEGEWINGKLHLVKEGVACVTDRRGNKYDGSFKNWKKHGYGTFTKVNGEKYSGYYVDDLRNGYGILTFADGSGFEGVFYNDEPTDQGHSIGRTLDKTDTISTLSVCRNNSMNLPEADDKGNNKQTNEEVFTNKGSKSNRKFLKNLNMFTRKSKSKDDDTLTLDNTLQTKDVTYQTADNNENNVGDFNTLQSIENKGKKFVLTPKKLKFPNLKIPKNKYRETNIVSNDTENFGIHQI